MFGSFGMLPHRGRLGQLRQVGELSARSSRTLFSVNDYAMSVRIPKVISISEAARHEKLYELPPEEVAAIGEINHIYGTLTPKGLQTTAEAITEFFGDAEAIVGCDVGCGDGELIYHLSRLLVGSSWSGFEISAQRVGMCCWHDFVNVWQGDCLKEHYAEFNVLHINDLMFDDDLAMQLEAKVAREFSGLLITYKAITAPTLRRISQTLADVPTETSWTVKSPLKTHDIHYYRVN